MKNLYLYLVIFLSFFTTFLNAQWTQSNNGVWGGVINSYNIIDSSIYIGTNSGLYFSTNYGIKWEEIGFNNYPINSIVNIDKNLFIVTRGNVYQMSDSLNGWIKRDSGLPLQYYYNNNLFYNGKVLILSTESGYFYSINKGLTWNYFGIEYNTKFVNFIFIKNDTIYSSSNQGGVLRSIDNGFNWTNVGLDSQIVTSLAINDNIFYTGLKNGNIALSKDGGKSWVYKKITVTNKNIISILLNQNKIITCTEDSVFVSNDNCETWVQKNEGLQNLTIFKIFKLNEKLFLGTNKGIFISEDNGDSWQKRFNGLEDISVKSLIKKDSLLFMLTEPQGLYKSFNLGNTWVESNNGLSKCDLSAITYIDSNIFLGTSIGLFLSTNNGEKWSYLYDKFKDTFLVESIYSFENSIYVGSYKGVYISTDKGKNWTLKNNGLTTTNSPYIFVISIIQINNLIIISTNKGIFYSDNQGDSWVNLNQTYIFSNLIYKNNILFGTGFNSIKTSIDTGKNWQTLGSKLKSSEIQIIKYYGENIFIGTNFDGLLFSSNNGSNWFNMNFNLKYDYYRVIEIIGEDIFIGNEGHGLFKAKIQNLGIDSISTQIRENLTSKQSNVPFSLYPNPSQNILNINIQQESISDNYIQIWDILGQSVFEAIVDIGENQIKINIESFPPGIYMVRIKDEIQKLIKY